MKYHHNHTFKMAENVIVNNSEIFARLISKIGNIFHGRTVGDRNILITSLDELNSLNFKSPLVQNPTKAVLLINQCCSFVPTDDKVLVEKCSKLLWNLSQQNISVEGRTLMIAVQWCLGSLRNENKDIFFNVLEALETLLRSNADAAPLQVEIVSKELKNLIINRQELCSSDTILMALQCLEACTLVKSVERNPHLPHCAETFISQLNRKRSFKADLIEDKVLHICLFGLQNVMSRRHQDYLKSELGLLLGFVKTYMLYGIEKINFLPPQKLLPSTFSIPEQPAATNQKKGGKVTKYRRHRSSGVHKKETLEDDEPVFNNVGYTPANPTPDYHPDLEFNRKLEDGLKTSDSDFSDNEAGKLAKVQRMHAKVRLTALNLLYTILKKTEKRTFLSYWSHFIPEDGASGPHNLIVCVLKDHSTKCKMSALNVLLLLLTSAKHFLSQAESSDKMTSFTPFSVVLGLTVTHLHKSLTAAINERYVPVPIQILKCFSALVQATPYHKLTPGLLSRLVRSIKRFIHNRDACVQVTALIVLGCILASEPVLPETSEVMLNINPNTERNTAVQDCSKNEDETVDIDSIDFAEFSDSDTEEDTPSEMPWLLEKCLANLGVTSDSKKKKSKSRRENDVVAAPVKLESLQVMCAMSRNYFEVLIAPYISIITKALSIALRDPYPDLRLHAARAIDFIGQAMNKYFNNTATKHIIPYEYYLAFWQTMFKESLDELVQSEIVILRAVGCDCLGSIGKDIFEKLPRDKQIVCITSLFSCTRDEEKSVRGAAIRALGNCISYPSLKEDPGCVIDTAQAIHRLLTDQNFMVRTKASWALGNLGDTLVLMSESQSGIEDIPENLILQLLQISIEKTTDHDKIKMNAVRSVGNLLRVLSDISMEKTTFIEIAEQALTALIGTCTTGANTKVRWNACYAMGNALKNPHLYQNHSNQSTVVPNKWQEQVFSGLTDIVVSYRNFKVRINAALALSSPSKREHYGKFFIPIWCGLLRALENSQNIDDFNEYKHRDHLVEQICKTLAHLTTLLQTDDLMQLQETVQLNLDMLKHQVHRVLERLLPENSTSLFSASDALTHMRKQSYLTTEQKNVVNCLLDIFIPEFY